MKQTKIGYSAFVYGDDAYLYYENSCYIFDSEDSLIKSTENFDYTKSDYRIDEINFEQIKDDYGVSCGDYIIGNNSFSKFSDIAKEENLSFKSEVDDNDENFTMVEIK